MAEACSSAEELATKVKLHHARLRTALKTSKLTDAYTLTPQLDSSVYEMYRYRYM